MPKRTNDFQQLMHYIYGQYGQLVPEGASVTESALLKERSCNSQREVDILIEYEIVGITIRIAIECRDRSRKNDIVWIDDVVGKYHDLDVNKVIAVSKSGFSREALAKASAHNIETLTLKRALSKDWPHEFTKLGLVKLSARNIHLKDVRIKAKPCLTEPVKLSDIVTDLDGNSFTLNEVLKSCFENKVKSDLYSYIKQHFMEIFKSLADLRKTLLAEMSLKTPALYLIDSQGTAHRITLITFIIVHNFIVEETQVENYLFNKDRALISDAVFDFGDPDIAYTIRAIQVKGKKQLKILGKTLNRSQTKVKLNSKRAET